MNFKLFLQDLKDFFYDQLIQYKKELNLVKKAKQFRFPRIFTTFAIKFLLTIYIWVLIIKGDASSVRTIFILCLVLFVVWYDEWKQPGWRKRKKERLYEKIKKKTGVDWNEKRNETKEKIKEKKIG